MCWNIAKYLCLNYRLSVVDKECEEYHRSHGIVVKSSLSYVKTCSNVASNDDTKNIYIDEEEDEAIDTRKTLISLEWFFVIHTTNKRETFFLKEYTFNVSII